MHEKLGTSFFSLVGYEVWDLLLAQMHVSQPLSISKYKGVLLLERELGQLYIGAPPVLWGIHL